MGLNSVGVRMSFEYEDCELLHIRDLTAGIHGSAEELSDVVQVTYGVCTR